MDGYVVIGTDLDTKSFDKQINYIERQLKEIEYKLKQADMGFEVGDTDKLEANYEKLSQQLTKLRQKQADLNKTDLTQTENAMKNISNATESVIKKVGKWALAVFSIRSAYNLISKTSGTFAQYNEQYAINLEYLRYVLAQAIAPVLQFIVNLAFKLLNFINAIVQSLFGVNLFSKASVKDFQKMSKSADSIKKSLQTAGFDEMNVLSDASVDSGGRFTSPTMDITKMEKLTVSSVTKLLDKMKRAVAKTFDSISENITNVLSDLGFSEKFIKTFELTFEGVKRTYEGFIDTIKGGLEIIWGLLTGNTNLVKQGFKNLLLGLSEILSGSIQTTLGMIKILLLAIIDILTPVVEWVWNYIIKPIIETFKKFIDTGIMIFSTGLSIIKGAFEVVFGVIEGTIYTVFLFIQDQFEAVKRILNGFKEVFVGLFTGDLKRALNGFKEAFRGVFDSLWGIAKVPLNLIITAINSLIKGVNKFSIKVPDWVPEIGGRNFGFNIPTIKYLKTGGIINLPNRGVPVGTSAFGGEAGAEGVIPLTDSQAMETLGETIGRYITINANIVNSMNGRVISREFQKIQASNNFAYNS